MKTSTEMEVILFELGTTVPRLSVYKEISELLRMILVSKTLKLLILLSLFFIIKERESRQNITVFQNRIFF